MYLLFTKKNTHAPRTLINFYKHKLFDFFRRFLHTLCQKEYRLQQCIHGGGSQHGSNLNVRVKYIWVDKKVNSQGKIVKDPLDNVNFSATLDRNGYNNWHKYHEMKFCCTSIEFQLDLQVSAGAMTMLYGEVSSLQCNSSTPALRRLHILASHILCYNKYAITFYAEQNKFSMVFYCWDDNNSFVSHKTAQFKHSPIIDYADDGDDPATKQKLWKKDLTNAVYGTPVTKENPTTPPNGFDLILKELVKCVLVMEVNCPSMLDNFDLEGDQYSTQDHNHMKHDFPVLLTENGWPCDAKGKKLPGNSNLIYKFPHMITKMTTPKDPQGKKNTTNKRKAEANKTSAKKIKTDEKKTPIIRGQQNIKNTKGGAFKIAKTETKQSKAKDKQKLTSVT